MVIRVLIVDDHSVVREGLRMFLARDPDLETVGEAADGAEAIQQARLLRPDVVIMDLLMPALDGMAATRTIRSELPETEILAFTSVLEGASVVEAIRAGAIGYLFKASLLGAVRLPERPEPLTPREMDVIRLLAQGLSNKEIARTLHLVEETVKDHVRHILAKLGVKSRTQAVLAAIRLRIVSPQS